MVTNGLNNKNQYFNDTINLLSDWGLMPLQIVVEHALSVH